jgi:hypothetical protein
MANRRPDRRVGHTLRFAGAQPASDARQNFSGLGCAARPERRSPASFWNVGRKEKWPDYALKSRRSSYVGNPDSLGRHAGMGSRRHDGEGGHVGSCGDRNIGSRIGVAASRQAGLSLTSHL